MASSTSNQSWLKGLDAGTYCKLYALTGTQTNAVCFQRVLTSHVNALGYLRVRRLSLFKRKVLRFIFGTKQGNRNMVKRHNYELYEAFNEPNIVNYIKVSRLAGLGI